MTTRELLVNALEGIYSLRFAILLLTLIIILLIIVQVCEVLYALLRYGQEVTDDNACGPTEIVIKDSGNVRSSLKTSRKKRTKCDRPSKMKKEAIVQVSLSSDGTTKSPFPTDEKSLEMLKSSSRSSSFITSTKSSTSKKSSARKSKKRESESDYSPRKYFGKKETPLEPNAPQLPAGTKDSLVVVSDYLVPLSSEKSAKEDAAQVSTKSSKSASKKEKSASSTTASLKEDSTQMATGSMLPSSSVYDI